MAQPAASSWRRGAGGRSQDAGYKTFPPHIPAGVKRGPHLLEMAALLCLPSPGPLGAATNPSQQSCYRRKGLKALRLISQEAFLPHQVAASASSMLAREEEVDVEAQQAVTVLAMNGAIVARFPHRRPSQDVLDKLDDAATELMTGDGDKVMLMLGDSFMQCEEEYATEYCERKQEVWTRGGALKKDLYARFGSSIQLEA
eukprot:jgi/Undpi1/2852/HiC_scaffold_14.g06229.m1